MQRDIRPDWLLRLADELGGRGAGRGQPRTTNLGRAVSSASYAGFHCLALSTARSALLDANQHEVFGVARHVSHAAIRQVTSCISGETPPKHLDGIADRLRQDEAVTSVAGTFLELSEQHRNELRAFFGLVMLRTPIAR